MQEETTKLVYRTREVGVVNSGAIILHNQHMEAGRRRNPSGCGVCRTGMEAMVKSHTENIPGTGVPESSGGDEEGSTSFPLNNWWAEQSERQLPKDQRVNG